MSQTDPLLIKLEVDENAPLLLKETQSTRANRCCRCSTILAVLNFLLIVALGVCTWILFANLRSEDETERLTLENLDKKLLNIRSEFDKFKSESTTPAALMSRVNAAILQVNQTIIKARVDIDKQIHVVQKSVKDYENVTNEQLKDANAFLIYQLSGMFCLLTCIISLWHSTTHWRHLAQPSIQRKILAIIWMPPIYSITSWLSLVFSEQEDGFEIVRSSYEGYTIYAFLALMMAAIGDQNEIIEYFERTKQQPPCTCCGHWVGASATYFQILFFGMQYVLIIPLLQIANFILDKYGMAGTWRDYTRPTMYIDIVLNISVSVALWGLMIFYSRAKKELAHISPFPKFMAIKGVIFMTYYQNLALAICANFGLVNSATVVTIQNFLVCIEMLLASIVHPFVFSYEEWQPGYTPPTEHLKISDNFALRDFAQHFRSLIKRRKISAAKESDEESQPLENVIESMSPGEREECEAMLDEIEESVVEKTLSFQEEGFDENWKDK